MKFSDFMYTLLATASWNMKASQKTLYLFIFFFLQNFDLVNTANADERNRKMVFQMFEFIALLLLA